MRRIHYSEGSLMLRIERPDQFSWVSVPHLSNTVPTIRNKWALACGIENITPPIDSSRPPMAPIVYFITGAGRGIGSSHL
jgi:hypothetical protein